MATHPTIWGEPVDLTVVVATFGDESWADLALERAVPSAVAEGVPVEPVHAASLHEARNIGLDRVATEWVVWLDADDELEPGYVAHMSSGWADVRAPSVRYVVDGAVTSAKMPRVSGHRHACAARCLPAGNWLVVGAAVRADLVRALGGWRDWPMYEDWDLWLRCHLAGASIQAVPKAVYRAHARSDSRNRAPDAAARLEAHRMIAAANGVPVP